MNRYHFWFLYIYRSCLTFEWHRCAETFERDTRSLDLATDWCAIGLKRWLLRAELWPDQVLTLMRSWPPWGLELILILLSRIFTTVWKAYRNFFLWPLTNRDILVTLWSILPRHLLTRKSVQSILHFGVVCIILLIIESLLTLLGSFWLTGCHNLSRWQFM